MESPLYYGHALVLGSVVMSVDHFTYDEYRKAYRAHFDPNVAPAEIDAAMWVIASYSAIVEGVVQEKVDGQTVVRFTLYPDRNPGRALGRLCKALTPRLRYTLESLVITSIQERCGRHNATRIKAIFWEGLMPNVDEFAASMVAGLLEPRAKGFQLRRDRRGLLAEVTNLHEAIGAFQQGETKVNFQTSKDPCPDCAAAASLN